jgi:uncharacterized protein (TIGR03437 family)
MRNTFKYIRAGAALAAVFVLSGAFASAQSELSPSAYRTLGQRDFQRNGLNMVEGLELNAPSGIALDTRAGRLHLFVSDTNNHRVLGWQDIRGYQNGDAPTLILGQPDPRSSSPLGIGQRGFNTPLGLAVNPANGDLYVADFMNSRILRFPDPFSNRNRVEPDAVFGQADFARATQAAARNTLNRPRALAFDSGGNLWVADSGNHRVVRFNTAVLNAPVPPDMDVVLGQRDFTSGAANGGGSGPSAAGFDTPLALAFGPQNTLYVSDFNNSRVLKFPAPSSASGQTTASVVWGQRDFTSRGASQQTSASTIGSPSGIAVVGSEIYVVSANENRVLVFSAEAETGAAAKNVIGQPDFVTTTPNASSFPFASPNSLSGPRDVQVDPAGNVFVADSGNHRVLSFGPGSKTATYVWGQNDFTANGPNQIKPSSINAPYKMAIDYSSQPYSLYVVDASNNRVLIWRDAVRFRNGDPADLVIGQPDLRTAAPNSDSRNPQNPTRTSLSAPTGIAIDQRDGTVYIADAGNNRVLRYAQPARQSGRIAPDAVIGQADFTSSTSAVVSASSLRRPFAVALAPDGNLFVADTGNHRVLEFPARAGTGSSAIRVYGQPNMSSSAAPAQVSAQTLAAPQGLYVDGAFNLYVADTAANRALIFPNTQSAPVAGLPSAFVLGQNSFGTTSGTQLKSPSDIVLDGAANIYVADTGNNRILAFAPLVFLPNAGASPTGLIGQRDLTSTTPNWNATGGGTTAEGLFAPTGLFVDRQDTVYVGDTGNNRVLHFLKALSTVNSATFQSGVPIAPGGLAALFGKELATGSATTTDNPWPTSLVNREVVINDEVRAPLLYMSSTQSNVQIPSTAPLGSQRLAVRVSETGELVAGGQIAIAGASPGLFTSTQDGRGQAAALNQDGRVNSSSNPAAKGSIVVLYGTGQGQVSPPVQDGVPAPAGVLSSTVTVPTSDGRACVTSQPTMCVAIGATFGDVQFSGLAPGFVGLWQINVRIPADAPSGNAVPLRVLINGTPSNVVSIAIR